jgi:putative acetyltransferase
MNIRQDDLSGPEVHALLQEHLRNMHSISPPESVHALDLPGLRKPGITFWTVWSESQLLGCGALREIDNWHGEVKSMCTTAVRRRQGVGKAMLRHIVEEASARGYLRLSLETGSQDAFEPARKLYESFGFTYCGPFDQYHEDPNSVFMTRLLAAPTALS